ncbi:MAG: hypothetical protein AAFX02_09190 [Pseudomonadota bacterium]
MALRNKQGDPESALRWFRITIRLATTLVIPDEHSEARNQWPWLRVAMAIGPGHLLRKFRDDVLKTQISSSLRTSEAKIRSAAAY